MVKPYALSISLAILATTNAANAQTASDQGPLFFTLEGLYAHQADTDLEDDGSFSVDRTYLGAGIAYRFNDSSILGISMSTGRLDYDFDMAGSVPWGTIETTTLSVAFRTRSERISWFVAPTLRYTSEQGAMRSEGETYGLFAGASWILSDRLRIGPAFGVFSELEGGGATAFPAVLVDWDITDQWNLSTSSAIGASRGPGLSLTYAPNDTLRLGLTGRFEETRFRLNDEGPAPGGVGEDRGFPLVVSLGYEPGPWASLNAFAGVELGGRLRLEDAAGQLVSQQEYDPAPIFGVQARFAF
jgi:hypothetical protein